MAGRTHRQRCGGQAFALIGLALIGFALVGVGVVGVARAEPVRLAEIVPVVGTPEAPPARTSEPEDRKTATTKRVQRCYAKLGYYKGPIDGKATDATWTAHWYFKNDHGLKSYGNFLSKAVLNKIDALCGDETQSDAVEAPEPESPEPSEVALSSETSESSEASETSETAVAPQPGPEPQSPQPPEASEPSQPAKPKVPVETAQAPEPPATPEVAEPAEVAQVPKSAEPDRSEPNPPPELPAVEESPDAAPSIVTARLPDERSAAEAEAPLPPSRLDIDCLPEDLLAIVRQAHGGDVRASACRRGCLPAPRGLSQGQLDDLYGRYGVVWCRSCVEITGHLSLKDIKRIEDAGDLQLCTTPPRQLPRLGSGNGNVVKSFSRIRELYRALPSTPESEGAIAVIIGNRAYDNLPPAQSASNDAGAMYFFLTEHLGFRQDHVIDLRDAKRADLERVFGPEPGSDGELKRLVRAQADAKVIVYYSGHGATNADHSESYLLPVEAQPYREERSGYPLSTLYNNLTDLGATSVLVSLEASFGRDHGAHVLPPNIPETTRSALPEAPLPALTVLAAADRGQRALLDTGYDIGLFTRYFVEGLAGNADLNPVGDGNGRVDSAELYAFTAAMVRRAARKTFGLLQQPVYSSDGAPVLKALEEVAAKPN